MSRRHQGTDETVARILDAALQVHAEPGREGFTMKAVIEVAPLSPATMEMLLIGPVAETARRWLSRDPAIDLEESADVLPPRIWRSLQP